MPGAPASPAWLAPTWLADSPLGWFKEQNRSHKVPQLQHQLWNHWHELLFSMFKTRLHLKPPEFTTWRSRGSGYLPGGRGAAAEPRCMWTAFAANANRVGKRGLGSVGLICSTYCKELKKNRNNLRVAVNCRNSGYLTCGYTKMYCSSSFYILLSFEMPCC